jgi:hypothetical protein
VTTAITFPDVPPLLFLAPLGLPVTVNGKAFDLPDAIVDADVSNMVPPDPRAALLAMVIWLQMGPIPASPAAVDMSSPTTITAPHVALLPMVIWLPMGTVVTASTPYTPLVHAHPNLVAVPFVTDVILTCPAVQSPFLFIISVPAVIPLFIRVDGDPIVVIMDMLAAISISIPVMRAPV